MAEIFEFPKPHEREWRELESLLREQYRTWPDGPSTFQECLPAVRRHWEKIFQPISIDLSYEIPGPLREEQVTAIKAAVNRGAELVVDILKAERMAHFALLVACEYKSAHFLRNGAAPV